MTEKQIGNKAKQMIFDTLKSEINSQNFNFSDDESTRKNIYGQRLTPLKRSTSHIRMFRDKKHQLRGIAVHMGKHGYVHNFGVDGIRKTHQTKSKKGRTYTRRVHQFKLQKRNFIPNVIKRSGAVEFLAREIPAIRGEEIMTIIKNSFK